MENHCFRFTKTLIFLETPQPLPVQLPRLFGLPPCTSAPYLELTCECVPWGSPSSWAGAWDPTAGHGLYSFAWETLASLSSIQRQTETLTMFNVPGKLTRSALIY